MTDHPSEKIPQIIYRQDGAIAWVIFDNSRALNALTVDMWRHMPGHMERAEKEEAVRVIILKGQGERAFSAGADISEFDGARTGPQAADYNRLNNQAFQAIANASKPTLAMIRGFCLGGGLALALSCDLRFAAKGSQFAIPAAKLGLGYNPRWLTPLLNVVGPSFAKEILFSARRFSAEEALAMGLLNRIFDPLSLEKESLAIAEEIAANAPLTINAAKRAIDDLLRYPENPPMTALDQLVEDCFASEDYAEGRAAFQQKRKPRFQGK